MILNAIKAVFHRLAPLSEEDRVINSAKAGDVRPFIEYFRDRCVPFDEIDHRRSASPTGRVVYENDIYSYVYVDGVWINRMQLPLPYQERKRLLDEMEEAVMGNVFGTTHYEKKHFAAKETA